MKKYLFAFFISLFLVILYGCGLLGDYVSVTDFSPLGEVKKLSSFKIEFSENLAPPDIQNKWLTDQFVEFEPKLEGKFKWTSGNTLIFSPDYPLQPIQAYKAKITNKVLFNTKFSPDFDTYEFHTSYFDVEKAEFFWTQIPNQNYKVSIKTNLHFNYSVNPRMLKDYLIIKNKGEEVKNYKIVSEDASEIIAIDLGEVQQTDKEQELEVIVKKGLFSVIGKKSLEDERSFSYDLPPITKLAITEVVSGFEDQSGWIEVYTTQRVDDKKIKDYVKIEPVNNIQFLVNENSFRIEGSFTEAQVVNLKIKKGLPGLYGGELEFDFEQEVSLVNLEPSIKFTDSRGKYLLLSGNRNLELQAVNIPDADVEVSQVFKNNVLYFITNNYDYYYEDYGYEYSPSYYVGNYGKLYYKEDVRLQNQGNALNKFTINLDKVFNGKQKGVFVVDVMSGEDRWIKASKMLSLTDLGIIAKKSEDELIVFINSLATVQPVENVEITLISSNNQTLLSGKTNSEGVIIFKDIKDKLKDFEPRIITAETETDFNYIDLNATEIETSRFDVGGASSYSKNYKVFLYGDRNLYRPGDQVNITGIVRNDQTHIVKDEPVIIKIISPTGRVYNQFKKILNEEGSFEVSFNIPDYIQTGGYRAEVYNGAESLVGSYRFSVEDIVPDKIRVTVKGDREDAKPGDQVKISVDAEYLFGAKASGLRYEANFSVNHSYFSSNKFSAYDFSNSTYENTIVQNTFMDGVLDEKGKKDLLYTVPQDLKSAGVATVYGYISVFDLTGRTVNRGASFKIYPEQYYVGIKSPGEYFGTNETLRYKIVAVDKDDKYPKSLPATAHLIRYEWQTVLKKDNSSRYYYASEKKEFKEWERNIDLSNGEKDLSFSVTKSGEYELRIFKKGSSFCNKETLYAYGWGSSTAASFEVDKEGKVEILADKEVYSPNDRAKILFTTPFSGKMLVTLERNGVYDYQYIEVNNRSAQLDLNLKEIYMPNVYITATLFKKHTYDNSTPFLVGHGFASIKIEKKDYNLPVSISAPKKIKPNRKIDVVVKTIPEKDVYVTLAAVDEGILQINNYHTPSPYNFMYEKQRLAVDSYDLYALLLPEILTIKSSTGGDGSMGEELKKRTNPITTKRFQLLSVWSGIRKTNSDGTVNVSINIPQFNGEVRLMAVAYTGPKFGSAEASMKVADDVIIEPQIPRFLAPNDSLIMPVTLINTTGKNGNASVNVKVEGPLKVLSNNNKNLSVPANATAQTSFVIKTGYDAGVGKIIIETSGFAKAKEVVNISVRPISPYVNESISGLIKAGNDFKIPLPDNFIQSTKSSILTISRFPAVQFAKQLRYLVGYPHGCVEQTVSKLFPQLYFEDLAKLVAPEYYKNNNPVYYVKEGIRKLESMQLWNGAISYWQGGTEPSWWGSVYAAHFLVEAKKAGFDVADNTINKLLNYLSTKAKEKHTFDYVTYSNNSRTVRQMANKEILYSLYVLALAGKGDISIMNYYKNRVHLVPRDCRYLLAGAYALSGKWNSYYEIIPQSFTEERTDRETGGTFDSEIRANAIMLNVLLEVEPNNKQVPVIIKYLSKKLKDIYSTQETSFAFLALGKAAKLTSGSKLKADIIADGKSIGTFTGNDITLNIGNNIKSLSFKTSGQGEAYYFQNTAGVKTREVKEQTSNMKITRTYYDYRTRSAVNNNNFYQGQLIVCRISLTGFTAVAENIAITDLIPSGFEIENPRLTDFSQAEWKSTMGVQYLDVRDDRLVLFTNLVTYTQDYYYFIRVVNKGKFQLPVISAEAMYDPEFASATGRGTIFVHDYR